jgi:hypothetical protein
VDGLLPQAHCLWYRAAIGVVDVPGSAPPFHDNFEWATHAYEQYRKAFQLLSTVWKNSSRDRIGIMVPYVHHDIESQAAVLCNGLIHGVIEDHNQRFEVWAFTSRP